MTDLSLAGLSLSDDGPSASRGERKLAQETAQRSKSSSIAVEVKEPELKEPLLSGSGADGSAQSSSSGSGGRIAQLSAGVPVLFRGIARDDVPALKVLQDVLFPVKYTDAFYDELFRDDYVVLLAFGAEQDSFVKLVGVATARWKIKSSACSKFFTGYIATLGVDPAYRKLGLGRLLVEGIMQQLRTAKPCESISLHCKADNEPAIRLYESCGFVVTKRLPQHYKFGGAKHDALRLARSFAKPRSDAPCAIL